MGSLEGLLRKNIEEHMLDVGENVVWNYAEESHAPERYYTLGYKDRFDDLFSDLRDDGILSVSDFSKLKKAYNESIKNYSKNVLHYLYDYHRAKGFIYDNPE